VFHFIEYLRRYLVILAVSLWMGGFTFYALFVLPTAHDVLGDRFASGLITRGVTISLNQLGIAAVLLMLWESIASCNSRCRWLAVTIIAVWLVVAVSHIGLFMVHPKLDALIDVQGEGIINRAEFRSLHTTYERISGVQWVGCLVYLWFILLSWRCCHRSVLFLPAQDAVLKFNHFALRRNQDNEVCIAVLMNDWLDGEDHAWLVLFRLGDDIQQREFADRH